MLRVMVAEKGIGDKRNVLARSGGTYQITKFTKFPKGGSIMTNPIWGIFLRGTMPHVNGWP
jgi:hypothetical protein